MAVAWMSYTLVVTALLFAAAAALEFVCRALHRPTRFVWLAASCLSVGLSARALLNPTRAPEPTRQRSTAIADSRQLADRDSGAARLTNPRVLQSPLATRLPTIARTAVRAPERAITSLTNATPLGADAPLAGALVAITLGGIAYLLVGAHRLRRVVGRLEPREVDGQRVFVSKEFGPALLGILKPRIVVPEWVLSLTHDRRSVILAHEKSHEDAYDPALLAFAAVLLALMPWNTALWFVFRRLRLALEVDCDRRVLASHTDVRGYGDLLVTVYERVASSRLRLAFVERPSNLEHRIRRLVDRAPKFFSGRSGAALAIAAGLVIAACETNAPRRTTPDSVAFVSYPIAGLPGSQLAEDILPVCLQRDVARANPWLQTIKPTARRQFPAAFETARGTHTVIGLVFDETCVLRRDTVMIYPFGSRPIDSIPMLKLITTVLGDTSGFGRSMAIMQTYSSLPRGGDVSIVQAVNQSAAWQDRMSEIDCTVFLRPESYCSIRGPVAIRVLDSIHVIIAARRLNAPRPDADELFLITLDRPSSLLTTKRLDEATVTFEKGAVFVQDRRTNDPGLLIARSSASGLADVKHRPGVTVVDRGVDLDHFYAGERLTLDEVSQLIPTKRCVWRAKACYEIAGCRARRAGYCPTFPFQIIPSVAARMGD